MLYLEGKVALLTGAAKGIAEETAYCFAEQGVKALVLVDRDGAGLEKVCRNLHSSYPAVAVQAHVSDIKDEADGIRIVADTVRRFERLDILVNIAGVSRYADFESLTMDDWKDMVDINLTGTFLYCREAFRQMQKQKGGRIINIASLAPYVGGLTVGGHYVASKGAVVALSRHIAKKGAPYNILCNTVAPGTIDTSMLANYSSDVSHIPLGHRGHPRDVANAILFFASDLSSFVTGQCLGVNGGAHFD